MKCPTCVAEGKRSKVFVGPSTSTCMSGASFYDEDGRPHFHDPNTTTTEYRCSNDHTWKETVSAKCWCEEVSAEVAEEAPPAPILYTPDPSPQQPRSIFDSMESLLGYPTEKR